MRTLPTLLAAAIVLAAGRTSAQAAPDPSELPVAHGDRLCVKLAEGSGAWLRDGVLGSRRGTDLRRVAALFARAAAEPLVSALTWDELDALHENACRRLPPGRGPGHLGLWFRLRCGSAAIAEALLADLLAEPAVEHAYLEPRFHGAGVAPVAQDLPPTTPLFTALQHAFSPSPLGHGVRLAQGILGGRGRGVGYWMLELSWILDHEDVSKLTAANFVGPPPPVDLQQANHGVAGSSLLMADRNAYGITGMVDELEPRFLDTQFHGGVENTMAVALAASQPGDVMMLVLMVQIPQLGPGAWLPAEFFQSVFDATLTLTANDRFLVVCAGNGNRSLDDPQLLRRFDRTFRDSGAIIVASSNAGLLQRASYSNWGSRIDAHSWGNQVVAAGYGNLFFGNSDPRQAYTDAYTGTSASTPHITGVVLAMQGAARRQLGRNLTLAEVQHALHHHGPSTPDAIGRRPDLVAIFRSLGILDGLTVDAPEVSPGGVLSGSLEAPGLVVAGLFLSPHAVDVDLGWNRNLHLDPAALIPLGTYVVPGAPVPWSATLPGDPSLQGLQLYFQAARIDVDGALGLTNSGHMTVL
ncbi:MAG: S8 family serine peptidase [Planctomycetes bacterium]|nr:S8 family serine peptidase [Planctomycetota bacterium]